MDKQLVEQMRGLILAKHKKEIEEFDAKFSTNGHGVNYEKLIPFQEALPLHGRIGRVPQGMLRASVLAAIESFQGRTFKTVDVFQWIKDHRPGVYRIVKKSNSISPALNQLRKKGVLEVLRREFGDNVWQRRNGQ